MIFSHYFFEELKAVYLYFIFLVANIFNQKLKLLNKTKKNNFK
jgi:hypothetical protein